MKLSRALVCALGAISIAACDIPTDVPKIDQRWVFPAKSTSIDVGQLLPSGVSIAGSGTAFAENVSAISVSQTLGQSCAACVALNGRTAPVPAFSTTITNSSNLPANVSSATLAAGTVNVNIQNNFGFDPTAGGGTATITLTSAGRTVGTTTLSNGQMPAGTTTRAITLTPGAIGSSITATTTITSNGGQTATINTNNTVSVTATPTGIQVGSAAVSIANKQVSFTNQNLDIDISQSLVDHVQSGSLILTITNPFNVAMTANMVITVPPQDGQPQRTISKQVQIPAGNGTVTLTYTGDELRSFLGKTGVTLAGTGTVASNAPAITVTPTQKVGIDTKLDLSIQVG
jgi:hypothetical protein